MLITVTRSGGFTGVEKTREVDTSARQDAAEWEGLARRVLAPPVADAFHYRITVDDQVLDVDETALTREQRELIRAVLADGS
ncbi:protealysin inhibitor emfourin [Streptomyces sp. NPDC006512]|uniref:protealysin inhibitor emfourin n=1 Tax=Streptomyces sp. NPDC006512 TaxID=3154307 RepID=UPI0033B0DF85